MTRDSVTNVSICVNDEARVVGDATSLAELMHELGLADRKGLAVAVNDAVVARRVWASRRLADGDRVLVIHATQGG